MNYSLSKTIRRGFQATHYSITNAVSDAKLSMNLSLFSNLYNYGYILIMHLGIQTSEEETSEIDV